jgi:riboflavin biosynthesis pyrimidine reductase
MMQQIRVDRDLLEITKLIDLRIPGDIVVEAGSTLLMALVEAGAIDFLELTLSPIAGDGDFIDVAELISHFEVIEEIDIDGTRLLQCRDKSYATNG